MHGTERTRGKGGPDAAIHLNRRQSSLIPRVPSRLADEAGVPPYVIFGDATLAEMAAYLPEDRQALLDINGVGKLKLRRYGDEFLEEIRGYLAGR